MSGQLERVIFWSMEKSIIFPGSFDPFTAGHEDLVRRALTMFDHVIVGVGCNIRKEGLLAPENRVRLIEDLFGADTRVEVLPYYGLTVDLCCETGIFRLLRGVRSAADFEGDRLIESVNRRLLPDIETVYLSCRDELAGISSSAVRELLAFGADTSHFMPRGIDIRNYLD